MKIEITRSGGFGGLTRTWSVDVSRMEAEQRWLPLAEAEAGGAAAGDTAPDSDASTGQGVRSGPGTSAQGPERDRFMYRITIGYTEVHLPESRLDDPWRELIERAKLAGTAGAPSDDAGPGKP